MIVMLVDNLIKYLRKLAAFDVAFITFSAKIILE